ncbi:MAG: ATP-binding protein [Lachnospiraceae bacterium]|nr:ATP-binding protein [Lachnospiraceae bacterium]
MPLTNDQYNHIMQEYAAARDAHRTLLARRRQELYLKLPEYKALEEELSSCALSSLKGGRSSSFRALQEKITEKKKKLLLDNGYPADFLEESFDCPFCRDTGYVDGEKCRCFKNREIALLYDQSHLKKLTHVSNFDLLSEDYYQGQDLERFRKAVASCHTLVERIEEGEDNIYLYGPAGTGKSFLSICCADALLKKGYSVLYFSAVDLFEKLSYFGNDLSRRETVRDLLVDLSVADLLILDDLGTELTNAFTSMRLFTVLNDRILASRSTIISTNLDLSEMRERYSDRIFSRICGAFHMHKLTGPDIRMEKTKAQDRRN